MFFQCSLLFRNNPNASKASFPQGWYNYSAFASYDNEYWFRVKTSYDGEILSIEISPSLNEVYLAYFEPYSQVRHQQLVKRLKAIPYFLESFDGRSIENSVIDVVRLGTDMSAVRKKIWIIARQHPGETMAEWFVEGILDQIELNSYEALEIFRIADIYLVPNMNPDGSMYGSQRSNAAGVNLNREWVDPSLERSPEVRHVKGLVEKIGVDVFLDIHGEESLPYAFVMGCEGVPSYNKKMAERENRFKDYLLSASPDFQDSYGYPKKKEREANLTMASNFIGETYDCLSLTIEMPYKDCNNNPNPGQGWTAIRSKTFSHSVLTAVSNFLVIS